MKDKSFQFKPITEWQKKQMALTFEEWKENIKNSNPDEILIYGYGVMSEVDDIYYMDADALESTILRFNETMKDDVNSWESDDIIEAAIIYGKIEVIVFCLKELLEGKK